MIINILDSPEDSGDPTWETLCYYSIVPVVLNRYCTVLILCLMAQAMFVYLLLLLSSSLIHAAFLLLFPNIVL